MSLGLCLYMRHNEKIVSSEVHLLKTDQSGHLCSLISLNCPPDETLDPCLSKWHPAKTN